MENRIAKEKTFYGWFIVAAGFLIMGCGFGIVYNTASLFIKPVSKELIFTRSEINATVTIRSFLQMMIAVFAGKIFLKHRIKRLMQISIIVLPLSFFCYSFSNTLITYYIITVVVSIAVGLTTVLPLSIIISNWFYERRGLAIGLTFMGSGVGGMVFNILAGLWITSYGWRSTYQILAVLMALILIPCVFFLIHIHPKDVGLLPLGYIGEDSTKVNKKKEEKEEKEEGLLLSEAVKTIHFWGLLLCAFLLSMCIHTLIYNIAPHLTDIGYSTILSANVVAMSMGSLAIFKVVLGQLYDQLGLRMATTISCIAVLLGLVGLIFANYYISLAIIIICVGLGCSSATIANPIITQKVFGRRDYSSIYGKLTAFTSLGGVIAPMISGYIFDITGSYNLAFTIFIGIIFIVIVFYQFIFSRKLN